MALPHAHLLDVIDVGPLGDSLHESVSTSLIRTGRLQLLHLVLPAHRDQPLHQVEEECVLHCLEGTVEVTMPGGPRRLQAGQLLVLPASQPHGLRARTDCAVLATILLRQAPEAGAGEAADADADRHGEAGDAGGEAARRGGA